MRRLGLLLDRDGVINIDHGYVHKPEDVVFIEGIFDLCHTAQKLGYLIIVITNQAGIGRGLYTEQDYFKLTEWMNKIFKDKGIDISKVYYCPYHPVYGIGQYKYDSKNRKPGPGMILQAEKEFNLDLSKSVLVGDKESDIQAGITAGVGCNLLLDSLGIKNDKSPATAIIKSLYMVERFLLGKNIKVIESP